MAELEGRLTQRERRFINTMLTGSPDTTWFDKAIARGPYGRAAALGCTGKYELEWAVRGASESLDVIDFS